MGGGTRRREDEAGGEALGEWRMGEGGGFEVLDKGLEKKAPMGTAAARTSSARHRKQVGRCESDRVSVQSKCVF